MLPTEQALEEAKRFCLLRWQEHLAKLPKRVRPATLPADLSNACRFTATFSKLVFGGEIQGNWYHVFCVLDNQVIDLTDGVQFVDGIPEQMMHQAKRLGFHVDNPMSHDRRVWQDKEFLRGMASVYPLAYEWSEMFLNKQVD